MTPEETQLINKYNRVLESYNYHLKKMRIIGEELKEIDKSLPKHILDSLNGGYTKTLE